MAIIIGIGGLVLSVLTYFAGVYRTEKRHSKDDRNARIKAVCEKYLALRSRDETVGLDGLQRAGVATLLTDDEIKDAIEIISKHGERNPLHPYEVSLSKAGLKRFFDYTARKRVNFFSTKVETILKEMG